MNRILESVCSQFSEVRNLTELPIEPSKEILWLVCRHHLGRFYTYCESQVTKSPIFLRGQSTFADTGLPFLQIEQECHSHILYRWRVCNLKLLPNLQ